MLLKELPVPWLITPCHLIVCVLDTVSTLVLIVPQLHYIDNKDLYIELGSRVMVLASKLVQNRIVGYRKDIIIRLYSDKIVGLNQ